MATNGHRNGAATTTLDTITGYWRDLAELAAAVCPNALNGAAELILDAQRRGRTVFVVGNGGSAATASHFACDLAKGTRVDGLPDIRVMPLTDNVALLTAWANDTAYDRVFAEQLRSLAREGDLLVAISCSGTSPNVVQAVEAARALGLKAIALTGRSGGALARLADLTIRIPADRIELVEDAHLAITHSLCVAIREQRQAAATATLVAAADCLVRHAPRAEPVAVDLSA